MNLAKDVLDEGLQEVDGIKTDRNYEERERDCV
jgi:hypothetical protein